MTRTGKHTDAGVRGPSWTRRTAGALLTALACSVAGPSAVAAPGASPDTPAIVSFPARFADTRPGGETVDGRFAGDGKVPAGATLEIEVAGRNGVTADARAVVFNVTATEPEGPGYLTAWACGPDRPGTSNVNYAAGQTVANVVFSELGAGGKVCVYTKAAAHVLVDVNGVLPSDSSFTPVVPARLADTRPGAATVDGRFAGDGNIAPGGVFEVAVAGRHNLPGDAAAAAVNVTVTAPAAAGHVSVWPCADPLPNVSTLNYAAGATVANAALVELSATGTVCVYSRSATDLVVDVSGYFAAGSSFATTAPARLADTRPDGTTADGRFAGDGKVADGGIVELQVAGRAGVPDHVEQVSLNVAVAEPDGTGYVTVWPCGTDRPKASNVNYATGQTVANAAFVPVGEDGTVCLFSLRATHLIVDVSGVFGAPVVEQPPATIASVSPQRGPAAGGTTVTITGANLSDVTAVMFGGTPAASFTAVSASAITAVTPAGEGTVDVSVTTPAGRVTDAAAFTFVPAPAVTAVEPGVGPTSGGTTVTITGANLSGVVAVTFGGVPAASVTVVSATKLTAVTPAGSGVADVAVATPGGQTTLAGAFAFVPAPAVTAVVPAVGPTSGGTTVTITGTNLSGVTAVTVGGSAAASFAVVSATELTAVTPAGSGTVDVTVVTSGGEITFADAFTYAPAPAITAVTPSAGPLAGGTTVTITGAGLDGTTSVTFDGVPATGVMVVSATGLTAVTPAGTGTVDVTLISTGGAVTAVDAYTYVIPPDFGIFPEEGPEAGGTVVTISGDGLIDPVNVSFDGVDVTATRISPTELSVISPAGTGTADVTVTTDGGSGTATFTYAPAPTITSISPAAGPTSGGTAVTITGSGFTGATKVWFDGAPGPTFTVLSDTEIQTVTPTGDGAVDVEVTTPGGTATVSSGFTYVPVPTMTSVSPMVGAQAGGTAVTVTGTDLDMVTAVSFGGVPASFTVDSDTQITVTTPAGTGTVDVAVTTHGGTATTVGAFTYAPAPTIGSVTPSATAGGTLVTITGTGFTGLTAVAFGGAPASAFVVDSDTQITAITPPGTGTVDVAVVSPGGTATAVGAFTYVPVPTIASVLPAVGPQAGGTTVTITGSDLDVVTAVSFGGVVASFTVLDDTQIEAVTPAGVGEVDVVVTSAGGSATAVSAFTYVSPPDFVFSPNVGAEAGGTVLTINGIYLVDPVTVAFDGVAVPVTRVSPVTLSVTAPAGTGTVDVTVSAAGGSTTKTSSFSYVPAPTVASITPAAGPTSGGNTVTISGTGLDHVTDVWFGAQLGAIDTSSATTLTVTVPANVAGTVDVAVASVGGSATAIAAYTYAEPPMIFSISPDAGAIYHNNSVTITGLNLAGATHVTFGGVDADVVSSSANSIEVETPFYPTMNTVDVTVTTPGGTATAVGAYTFA